MDDNDDDDDGNDKVDEDDDEDNDTDIRLDYDKKVFLPEVFFFVCGLFLSKKYFPSIPLSFPLLRHKEGPL